MEKGERPSSIIRIFGVSERPDFISSSAEDALYQTPGAPFTYFNDGGGCPSDFFASEILAQSDFFGSMKRRREFLRSQKNRGIFWGCEKRTKGFFWVR